MIFCAKLLWILGWEKDDIRRHLAIVQSQHHLPKAVKFSLDLLGYDLGVPRFPPQPYSFDPDTVALYHLDDQSASGQQEVDQVEDIMKRYPTWVVTVEGHCDERGTAEYNLALGEKRAVAVKTYLVALGVSPDRLRTVSYGKEFPFDAGHDEAAWAKNRRAHFVITAK